jgi:polysaccharide pyruvyl transferase WcaK-like protein
MEATGCSVVLFPFHTGTLSNDDHLFCALVRDAMKHPERVSLARFTSIGQTLALMAGCRVMVTTPLHGAILSVVAGALPVAVPYSSKCTRFMEMAGLESLSPDSPDGTPVPETAVALESAWSRCGQWWEHLARTREMMMKAAENTADHFRRRILGC